MRDFRLLMREKMALLKLDDAFAARYVNEGFSGGEKKRLEMLQMAVLQPEFAILDETDSGLDIDALRIVAEGVNAQLSPDLGVLLITHYQRLLNYITPDVVHVLAQGKDDQIRRSASSRSSWRKRATPRSSARPGWKSTSRTRRRSRRNRWVRDDHHAARASRAHRHRRRQRGSSGTSNCRAARRRAHPCGLPDVPSRLWRPSPGVPGLRCHRAQAAVRGGCGQRLLHQLHRQHPSRHLHHRRGGDGCLRGGTRHDRALHRRA